MKTITEYDRGYWIAVQNVASFDFQPDKQAVKALIRDAGFDRDTCLKLMDEYDFLCRLHFDYRGLIHDGSAINVHDLPKNPYES